MGYGPLGSPKRISFRLRAGYVKDSLPPCNAFDAFRAFEVVGVQ